MLLPCFIFGMREPWLTTLRDGTPLPGFEDKISLQPMRSAGKVIRVAKVVDDEDGNQSADLGNVEDLDWTLLNAVNDEDDDEGIELSSESLY